ncbi:MAG TPA: YceI family protein [Solirubrobacteraceae bacterium]|nr:YceI family protein [Solirubrobacteraceae bacterium]
MSATATHQITIPTGDWAADPTHSAIEFSVKHMAVATFRGRFAEYDAKLHNADGEPRLIGDVKVESITVPDDNLTGHLLSPDFFDAERHPAIRFESVGVRYGDDGALVVEGDLTIKGTTRRVEAAGTITEVVEDIGGNDRFAIRLETVVDRTAYGLDWNAPLPRGGVAVANDVRLTVELELTKAS